MRMITKRQVLALLLCATMVLGAGCAGWGTDGPADQDQDQENNQSAPNESAANNTSTDTNSTNDTAATDEPNDSSGSDSGADSPPTSTDGTDDSSDTDTTDEETPDSTTPQSDEGESDSGSSPDGADKPEDPSSDESDDSGSDTPPKDNASQNGSDEPTEDEGDETDNETEPSPNESTDNETEPEPETHTLTVSVVDEDGEPISGADVSVATYDGGADVASGTTDENGEATFSVADGSYEVLVDHEDYKPNASDERLVEVDGSDASHSVTLAAQDPDNGSDTATGIVRVVDENGEAIEGEPVTLTPPATVQESGKETRHTNEDGEVVIELLEGDPTDVVMFGVEVRGEQQTLGIMSDQHTGVQEVVFEVERNPGHYTYEYTVQVVDESGAPIEGETIRIGTPGEDGHPYTTNEHGEVSDSFMNSSKDDVVEQEIVVRGESYYMHVERGHQSKVIEVSSEESAPNESTSNETAAAA